MLTSAVKTVAFAALALPSVVLAALDKPALWPNLDFTHDGLQNVLQSHSHSIAVFLDGYIANACLERANAESYNPWDITTYVVKYSDCNVEWLMCRHRNAGIPLETFVDNFGRVPVHMRQAVKAVMLGADHGGLGAYAYGDMVVFFNRPDNVAVYIHEVTHAVEWSQHFPVSGGLSGSSVWLNAYNADSAVPDGYAQNNQVENLAQQPGPLLFNRYVNGGIGAVASGYDRIRNQQNTMGSQGDNGIHGPLFQKDNVQCTDRKDNGGWTKLPPKKRFTAAERRAFEAVMSPLASRPNFPNTPEEQKDYAESVGVNFIPATYGSLTDEIVPTNCSAFI